MNARVQDMAGKRFGNLVAIQIVGRAASGDLKWEFICDCGKTFHANGYYARSGKITTCPSCSSERVRNASVIHGKSGTREFEIWTGMHTRCYNKNAKAFSEYGGRGISICQRWRDSFDNFLSDIGPAPTSEHSIDRRDNDGNYSPENCYWATRVEQANNKRNNIKVTIGGITKNLSTWAREYGVQAASASLRYRNGLRGEALFKTSKVTLTYDGITDTVRGWSNRTGIKPSTISMRVGKYHWPVERALTEGAIF